MPCQLLWPGSLLPGTGIESVFGRAKHVQVSQHLVVIPQIPCILPGSQSFLKLSQAAVSVLARDQFGLLGASTAAVKDSA